MKLRLSIILPVIVFAVYASGYWLSGTPVERGEVMAGNYIMAVFLCIVAAVIGNINDDIMDR